MNVLGTRKELIADTAISGDGDTLSNLFALPRSAEGAYLEFNVSSRTDGSYVLTLQHSPDGTNWYDVQAMGAVTADGQTLLKITETDIFYKTRLKVTASAVTTGATVNAVIHYS